MSFIYDYNISTRPAPIHLWWWTGCSTEGDVPAKERTGARSGRGNWKCDRETKIVAWASSVGAQIRSISFSVFRVLLDIYEFIIWHFKYFLFFISIIYNIKYLYIINKRFFIYILYMYICNFLFMFVCNYIYNFLK